MIDYHATLAAMRLGCTATIYEYKTDSEGFTFEMKLVLKHPDSDALAYIAIEHVDAIARWALWLGYKEQGRFTYKSATDYVKLSIAKAAMRVGFRDAEKVIAATAAVGDKELPEYLRG